MDIQKIKIHAVPTNIITGFLGAGKTSTILHLLKNKPADERWAILVNEFGEIGVDKSLIEGQQTQEDGVYIREVPGGCMCCAAGVPMQVALNQLLKTALADRLLIEPTGLGHPKEVLEILSSEHYQKVLTLQKTLTLVDARNLSKERYTNHETFNQQIEIGDTIVGNKSDLYSEEDKTKLIDYIEQKSGANKKVIFAEHGDIKLDELEGKTSQELKELKVQHQHLLNQKPLFSEASIPECGYIKAVNNGEGFASIGWRFSSESIFDHSKLSNFVWKIRAERVKAVFITNTGMFSFNLDKDVLTENTLESCDESRIEIIRESSDEVLDKELAATLEDDLMKCIVA